MLLWRPAGWSRELIKSVVLINQIQFPTNSQNRLYISSFLRNEWQINTFRTKMEVETWKTIYIQKDKKQLHIRISTGSLVISFWARDLNTQLHQFQPIIVIFSPNFNLTKNFFEDSISRTGSESSKKCLWWCGYLISHNNCKRQ